MESSACLLRGVIDAVIAARGPLVEGQSLILAGLTKGFASEAEAAVVQYVVDALIAPTGQGEEKHSGGTEGKCFQSLYFGDDD